MSNESDGNTPSIAVECNVFATHPSGFKAHFKMLIPAASGVATGPNNIDKLVEVLVNKGYMPDGGPGKPTTQTKETRERAPAQPQRQSRNDDVPECPECGGPVWDNRSNKRNPKGPDYTCKDKANCGMVGWENSDGGVRWQEPRN